MQLYGIRLQVYLTINVFESFNSLFQSRFEKFSNSLSENRVEIEVGKFEILAGAVGKRAVEANGLAKV